MVAPDAAAWDELAPLDPTDADVQRVFRTMGVPAFVRRGQDLDDTLSRLHRRCRAVREEMLEMTHLRLRQWAAVATGPDDWSDAFAAPVAPLWELSGAPEPPRWGDRRGSSRRRRAVARDLAASVSRFNRRWSRFLAELDLRRVNRRIEDYNSNYLIEKECVVGSGLVAARLFRPVDPVTPESLLERYPPLPEPRVLR